MALHIDSYSKRRAPNLHGVSVNITQLATSSPEPLSHLGPFLGFFFLNQRPRCIKSSCSDLTGRNLGTLCSLSLEGTWVPSALGPVASAPPELPVLCYSLSPGHSNSTSLSSLSVGSDSSPLPFPVSSPPPTSCLLSSVQQDGGLSIAFWHISCSPLVNILSITVINASLKWD